MSDAGIGIGAVLRAVLVKWDGEPPEGADPIGHPQCIEIIEINPGEEPRVVYQRKDEWQT
jgi:hypothetical protein